MPTTQTARGAISSMLLNLSRNARIVQALGEQSRPSSVLADFLNVEATLLYSSGYLANLGVFNALLNKQDNIFQDKFNHASLIDAGISAQSTSVRFSHLNLEQLEKKLRSSTAPSNMVVSDAVFSMDGDVAPLKKLHKLTQQYQAQLMIDDAHGFGVLGLEGKGLPEQEGLAHNELCLYMATCGKAMGVAGAFIAASKDIVESLIQFSRTYTYTTSMPAAQAETLRESLLLIKEEKWRRDKLNELICYFKQCANQLSLELMPSNTAIQPILLGSSDNAINLSNKLLEHKLLVTAVRPPTVPQNTSRLRITLSANHTHTDIDQLFESIIKYQDINTKPSV